MEEGLEPYIPKGPRKLVDHYRPKFQIRTGSHDEKAIETVWARNSYRRHRDGFQPKPGELWLDIGANVGAFGVMAHKFGAEVVSIEPEPSNATLCASNLEFNGIDNPEVLEVAVVPDVFVGDWVTLFTSKESHRRHSIARPRRDSVELKVPARTLASLVDEFRPDGIKMSIEGAEIQILQNLELPGFVHYLVAEWNFQTDNRLHTLAQGFERMAARYRKVEMSKKVNFTRPTFDFYPASIHLYGWD